MDHLSIVDASIFYVDVPDNLFYFAANMYDEIDKFFNDVVLVENERFDDDNGLLSIFLPTKTTCVKRFMKAISSRSSKKKTLDKLKPVRKIKKISPKNKVTSKKPQRKKL